MTNLKCHFDADGWLQGPITITHLLTPNRYNSGFGNGQGVVFHTESGYEQGTVATFMNPASQVSAFFSVGQSGAVTQYLPVGKGMVAWSQMSGNETFRGIEDEDRTDPAIPLTEPQLTAFAQIFEACSAFDGFPLQITDDPVHGRGLITHGDGGAAWGSHFSCPGDVRKAQRPKIIELARSIRQGGAVTPPSSVTQWTTAGLDSLAQLAATHGCQVSAILRLTAGHSPGQAYAPNVAAYLNGVFAGKINPDNPVPAGLVLYLPETS